MWDSDYSPQRAQRIRDTHHEGHEVHEEKFPAKTPRRKVPEICLGAFAGDIPLFDFGPRCVSAVEIGEPAASSFTSRHDECSHRRNFVAR
jgi:hypothetical protein